MASIASEFESKVTLALMNNAMNTLIFTLKETVEKQLTASELSSYLDYLIECNVVARVGVNAWRYVAIVHSKPWFLQSVVIPRTHKKLAADAGEEIAKKRKLERRHSETTVIDIMPDAPASQDILIDVSPEHLDENADVVASEPVALTVSITADRDESCTNIMSDVAAAETDNVQGAESFEPSCSGVCAEAQTSNPEDTTGTGYQMRKRKHSETISSTDILSKSEQKVLFKCRQWRKPDGYLNRKVLQSHLSSVLSCIMQFPGITVQKAIEKYVPILQPVQTLELIEMLETIGAITKVLGVMPSTSLFSPRTEVQLSSECDIEIDDEVSLEATFDCVLRLGRLFAHL